MKPEVRRVLEKFAAATGVDIVFYETEADQRGDYVGANGFYRNGTVYLDVHAGAKSTSEKEAVLITAAHEFTHFIRENTPRRYNQLKEFVTEHLLENGYDFETLVEQKIKAAQKDGGLSRDAAIEEVVADACEMVMGNSKAIERLANEKPGLAKRIADWLHEFFSDIRKAFEGVEARHEEAKAMLDYMDELTKLWDDALVEASSNAKSYNGKLNAKNTDFEKNTFRWSERENTALKKEDSEEYMRVGNRQHVRDLKNNMLRRGDSPILYTKDEIQTFIKGSLNGEIPDTIKAYGRVGTRMADDIAAKSNRPIDISGYYLELDSNRIEHMKDHVEDDNDSRNIPLTTEQIQELPYYIDTYDEVLDVLTRKDGSTRIYLGKESESGNIVILELVSKGRKSVQPVTAWQNTKENYHLVWDQKKKVANTSHVMHSNTESGYKATYGDSIARNHGNDKENFSRRDSAEGLTKEEARAQAAAYTRLKAENAELQRRVEYWKGQTQRTKQATVRQTDVNRFARQLIKRYGSTADQTYIRQALQEMGDYLVQNNGEALDYNQLHQMAVTVSAAYPAPGIPPRPRAARLCPPR